MIKWSLVITYFNQHDLTTSFPFFMGRKKMLQKYKQLCLYYDQARWQNFERWLLASSCLSVCLSVRPSAWNNSAPTGRILTRFNIWVFLENLSKKLKFYKSLTRITGILQKTNAHLWQFVVLFFLEWGIFWTNLRRI
jgi:hypothetical protein